MSLTSSNKFCSETKQKRNIESSTFPVFSYSYLFLSLLISSMVIAAKGKEMVEALDQAIEKTKLHHSADRETHDSKVSRGIISTKNSLPLRMEKLDVERLNLLIKTFDKAWMMPKIGFHEPVGSNFQARLNPCSHSGFGIMCFNFCYEQGEKMVFKCEDSSDFNFCKTHTNFDQYLSKYKKDPYRAKAYIHQMLTRCYLSAVCNGNSLLNSTLITGGKGSQQRAMSSFDGYGKGVRGREPQSAKNNNILEGKKAQRWNNHRQSNHGQNSGNKKELVGSKMADRTRRRKPSSDELRVYRPQEVEEEDDTLGEGGGPKKYITPKYVPYWRKLLVRTTTESPHQKKATTTKTTTTTTSASPQWVSMEEEVDEEYYGGEELQTTTIRGHRNREDYDEAEDEGAQTSSAAEEEESQRRRNSVVQQQPPAEEALRTSTRSLYPSHQGEALRRRRPLPKNNGNSDKNNAEQNAGMEQQRSKSLQKKYRWKSLPKKATAKIAEADLIQRQSGSRVSADHHQEQEQIGGGLSPPMAAPAASPTLPVVGFWKEFQPNRWFQSIHYITNTG